MNKKALTIDLKFYENEKIHLDKVGLKRLIDLIISERLSNAHLAYICDCLTLTDKLTTDEKIKAIICELADPEINGGYASK